ncbi:hypothetical protein HMPREF1250_0471 [Megasphaera vaginalis (ex Srinivasan et al. 2021)]|uniref:Uncharacterized protein n=1 Tax=Megasphaera vaginalis (ex Srinivasan et al. 2021) TaxID=1111454 RepID=U7UDY3_9FIRM|nr:hypothetical protein HMPREF1250_0471 [Megasphaera vaginalis (ex Srinivasan et al. 2021)]
MYARKSILHEFMKNAFFYAFSRFIDIIKLYSLLINGNQ